MTDLPTKARHRPGLFVSGRHGDIAPPPDLTRLAQDLGVALQWAVAEAPLDIEALTDEERRRWDAFASERRRRAWLTGRRAMKSVLSRLGHGTDTSGVTFPHPSVSLTHAGHVAVAVGSSTSAGIGVDYEPSRELRPGLARRYLRDDEIAASPDAGTTRGRLRLWTVKEALFKACPANAGLALRDIRLLDASRAVGRARVGGDLQLLYATTPAWDGWLSLALLEGRRQGTEQRAGSGEGGLTPACPWVHNPRPWPST